MKSFFLPRRFKRGFTLIELLVVIVIIALLMAIAIPAYLSQQKKAKDSKARTYLNYAYRVSKGETIGNNKGLFPASASLVSAIAGSEPELSPAAGACSSSVSPQNVIVSSTSTANSLILCNKSDAGGIWTLTIGSTGGSPSLVESAAALGASALGIGEAGSCILLSDKTLKCWGPNQQGQVGDNSIIERDAPVAVPGLANVSSVVGNSSDTCAIVVSGALYCWGVNNLGQLGDGGTTDQHAPELISGLANVLQVSHGSGHGCALISGGSIKCWGWGFSGQLGNGLTGAPAQSLVPTSVGGITTATAIASESTNTCALLSDKTIKCWGYGTDGNLGNGTTPAAQSTPVSVTGISTATAIAASSDGTCALLTGGSISCWGSDFYGQNGDGLTGINESTPVSVTGITTAVAIAGGNNFYCALLTGGAVKCWGQNFHGALGDGTINDASTPVSVSGLTGASAISVRGTNHVCALISAASVKCWGYGPGGQLGTGSVGESHVPVSVSGF